MITCRSVEYDHVKANLLAKLLCICTFGKIKLSELKELISTADFKLCKETKKSRPTWYHLTMDVFVKFLYKVILPFYNLLVLNFKLLMPYISILVL